MRVLVNDDLASLDLARALEEISPERRAYALRYRQDLDRRLSVAVYLLLKEALREEYGIEGNPRLAVGPNGKPHLPDNPDVHFNFSHCTRAAACVVSDGPVGIDIEEIAPVNWEVARRVLSADELAKTKAAPEPETAFARYWTCKEALVKLTGEGLEDGRLKNLLAVCQGAVLDTKVRRERGYVLTTATRDASLRRR